MAALAVLYGKPMAGKTTLLAKTAAYFQGHAIRVSGLLSPAVFENGVKTAILAHDIISREEHLLARKRTAADAGSVTPGYDFVADTLVWGNRVLSRALPSEVFLLDEVGPKEIMEKSGWQAGIEALLSRQYRLAVVVLRESLHEAVRDVWQVDHWLPFSPSLTVYNFEILLRKELPIG